MLTETKLGIATVGAGLATIGTYEWAPHIEFFQQNEALLHNGQIGLFIATTILALATAGATSYRKLYTEGELINHSPVEIIPFNPNLSRMSSNLMKREAQRRKS